jgi:type II secretory ATPase GspE/PulE/Tfp pilus assembly ATPase PilB-like protein
MRLLPAVVEKWKTMAACDVNEKFRPQDGTIIFTASEVGGEGLGLRVCFLPAVQGESVTVRLLSTVSPATEFDLSKLGFFARDEERLRKAIARPWGLIILTGPTGTGKTTTLYSCLKELAKPQNKIITIEDPVECTLPGMTQVQIKPEAGLTFASAMRAAFRSAPNVILLGEVRDGEALNLCNQAALTGHLVFTTLHASDAVSAVKRMVDIGLIPQLVADTGVLIASQRLVRRVCPHCSKDVSSPSFLERAMEMARRGGLDPSSLSMRFREGAGCPKCNTTGYRGRTVIAETMEFTPELQAAIRRGASVDELRTVAIGQGMTTFTADGIRKSAAGITTVEEVIRTVGVGGY